jgi:phosphatidylethanolamine N-methyltransferase
MDFIASYIDIYDYNLQVAVLSIIVAPIVWNILARIEYYTHLLTKLACGNKYWGCYGLALYIFSFSLFRDYL